MTRLLAPLLLAACIDLPIPVICTEEVLVSVTVLPVDESGTVIDDAEVSFRQESNQVFEPCMEWNDGAWACGFEIEGDLEIRVDGWGFSEVTETVTIEADECHVISQELTVTLPEVACTADVVPSLIVEVVDTDGSPVTDASVVYVQTIMDQDAPLACIRISDNEFLCGEEIAGELWVEATAGKRGSWTDTVVVQSDECHVITEYLTAELMILD